MKIAEILVGLPYAGKSTYAMNHPELELISTDAYIEEHADSLGTTYDKVFSPELYDIALERMGKDLVSCMQKNYSIIWDQTNLTVKTRTSKVKLLKEQGYFVRAVVFPILISDIELQKRMTTRSYKRIPLEVLRSMHSRYQVPTKSEGFDEIIFM